jgi:hypothetical protein
MTLIQVIFSVSPTQILLQPDVKAIEEEFDGRVVDDSPSLDKAAPENTVVALLSLFPVANNIRHSSDSSATMMTTASPVMASRLRTIAWPKPWGPGLLRRSHTAIFSRSRERNVECWRFRWFRCVAPPAITLLILRINSTADPPVPQTS